MLAIAIGDRGYQDAIRRGPCRPNPVGPGPNVLLGRCLCINWTLAYQHTISFPSVPSRQARILDRVYLLNAARSYSQFMAHAGCFVYAFICTLTKSTNFLGYLAMEGSTPRLLIIDHIFKKQQYIIYDYSQSPWLQTRFLPSLFSTIPNVPHRLNRFLSSSRSSFPLSSLISSLVNETPPEPLVPPIAVSPLPFVITNRPLSVLHLEMTDWFELVWDMARNYASDRGSGD